MIRKRGAWTLEVGRDAPPVVEKMWEAVMDGTIDFLGSDHAPMQERNITRTIPFILPRDSG